MSALCSTLLGLLAATLGSEPAERARVFEIWAKADGANMVEGRALTAEGWLVARWPDLGVNPGESAWLDSVPDELVLEWRVKQGAWKRRVVHLRERFGKVDTSEWTYRVVAAFATDSVAVFADAIPRHTVEPEARLTHPSSPDFGAMPLASVRFGSPGTVGLQGGLVAGFEHRGGDPSLSMFGVHATMEADLDAPSWRVGGTLVSLGGRAGMAEMSLSAACRLESWGGHFEGCGPEIGLALLFVHARMGWMPDPARASFGMGLGI